MLAPGRKGEELCWEAVSTVDGIGEVRIEHYHLWHDYSGPGLEASLTVLEAKSCGRNLGDPSLAIFRSSKPGGRVAVEVH